MRKKYLALFLTVLCVAVCTLSVYADEPETKTDEIFTVDESMIDTSLYNGSWVTFFDNIFDLYIPETWEPQVITDEDMADDLYYFFYDEENGQGMGIFAFESDAALDMDGVEAMILEDGNFGTPERWITNGVEILVFSKGSQFIFSCPGANGGYYMINVDVADKQNFQTAANIVYSFRPTPEEPDTEETETEIIID